MPAFLRKNRLFKENQHTPDCNGRRNLPEADFAGCVSNGGLLPGTVESGECIKTASRLEQRGFPCKNRCSPKFLGSDF